MWCWFAESTDLADVLLGRSANVGLGSGVVEWWAKRLNAAAHDVRLRCRTASPPWVSQAWEHMSMASLTSTAREIVRGLDEDWPPSDLVRLLAQAVEDFDRLHTDDERREFLEEPDLTEDVVWDAALAALAIYLCRKATWDRTPDWTREPCRFAPRITWIGLAEDSALQAFVYQRTPAYFKSRGVMLSEDNLVSI